MTRMLEEYRTAKARLSEAQSYLGKIGKESNSTARHRGTLNSVAVKTQVYFQPNDGATNYHDCPAFDEALSKVIARNFTVLKQEAIAFLHAELKQLGQAARDDVAAMQRELDDLTNAPPEATP